MSDSTTAPSNTAAATDVTDGTSTATATDVTDGTPTATATEPTDATDSVTEPTDATNSVTAAAAPIDAASTASTATSATDASTTTKATTATGAAAGKRKVGFAPLPDLLEHHQHLQEIEAQKRKNDPFQRIPPELLYLEKKKSPKPLDPAPIKVHKPSKVLGDLKKVHVKDISVVNKDTEINFNYPSIELPIPKHNILVSVKYSSLNSFDISKLNKYYYNFSDTKVGLGYEFTGEIVDIGSTAQGDFAKGDLVMGILSPYGRKGSLSSSLLLNPAKDFLVKLDDLTLQKLDAVDIKLSFDKSFEIDDESDPEDSEPPAKPQVEPINALAKASAIPLLYCKAKQALQHLSATSRATILINGADTNLGYTLVQILNSSLYEFSSLRLILVVKESSLKEVQKLAQYYLTTSHIEVLSYDLQNEDLVLPGEKVPINYKKPDLMAIDLVLALFNGVTQPLTPATVNDYKLDLLIDITGSHYLQKTSIKYKKLDYLTIPATKNLGPNVKILDLFSAGITEQLFIKLLKPKATNSAYVSFCKFSLSEPSYSIDTLIDYSTQAGEQSIFNPWGLKWSRSMANSFLKYNYYDEINLATKRDWIIEGLNVFLRNELKFHIDHCVDWRNNFKAYVKTLRRTDGKVIFKVEDF